MVELLVVISVVSVLLALLMPGLGRAKAAALKLMCAANERELGIGFMLYSEDHSATLPESHFQNTGEFAKMSAVTTGEIIESESREGSGRFDGLGVLWQWRYIDSPDCLHCPANRHRHTREANEAVYASRGDSPTAAYCNYHYTGHLTWSSVRENQLEGRKQSDVRRTMIGKRFVLSSDSLRSREDFSHGNGVNLLFSDGSVQWATPDPQVIRQIPLEGNILQDGNFANLGWITAAWDQLEIDG